MVHKIYNAKNVLYVKLQSPEARAKIRPLQ